LRLVTENISKGSAIVMTDAAQYLVWNDPNSSDPTHSMLSKDHFRYSVRDPFHSSCYLNEPAGKVAKVIVQFVVTQVVAAWSSDTIDPRVTIGSILQCFYHPAALNPSSKLHNDMLAVVKTWVDQLPATKKSTVLTGLTREGVKQGLHHDDEKQKLEQQPAVQRQAQPTLPQLSGSRAVGSMGGIGAIGTAGIIGSTTTTSRTGTMGSTGTFYAQGMVTSSVQSNAKQTTGFRLWPYNMDYYTHRDDNSLAHLSPYYQQLSGFQSQTSVYGQQTMSAYKVPSTNVYSSSSTLPTTSVSIQSTTPQSVLSTQQTYPQSPTTVYTSTGASGSLPATSTQQTTGGYTQPTTSMYTSPATVPGISTVTGSQQSTGTYPQPTTSIYTSPATLPGISTITGSQQSTGAYNLPTSNAYSSPATVPGSSPVTGGQGTNSSYYGQVTDHGKAPGQSPLTSPVQLASSQSPVQQATVQPLSQLSSVQGSLQNMNINVSLSEGVADRRMVLDREDQHIIVSRNYRGMANRLNHFRKVRII
jgi:hypothetical protein